MKNHNFKGYIRAINIQVQIFFWLKQTKNDSLLNILEIFEYNYQFYLSKIRNNN